MASFIPTSQVRETATKQHEVTFSALQVVREVRFEPGVEGGIRRKRKEREGRGKGGGEGDERYRERRK